MFLYPKIDATPFAPGGVSLSLITAVNNQASLSWSSLAGATSYNIKRSTTNGSGYTTVANVPDTSDIDQGLTNGTPYYYVVTALNGTTESPASNQVAATPTAQAFGFLDAGNGSVISGDVLLHVSMASNKYGDEGNQITLQVDGQYYEAGGSSQTVVNGSSGANAALDLNTETFANGTHTLAVKDVKGNMTAITVTFSNAFSSVNIPSMFDTTGSNGLPTKAVITANLGTIQPWTVTINTYDAAATVIKTFSGNSSTINVTWDGTGDNGSTAPDDTYQVVMSSTASAAAPATSSIQIQPLMFFKAPLPPRVLNKNAGGDCFLLIDPFEYPNKRDLIPYLAAIKSKLLLSKNNVWNKMSMFVATGKSLTPPEISAINSHFKSPLAVFYVACEGGQDNYLSGPQFNIGGHFWHASYSNTAAPYSPTQDDNMQALTASANYDVNYGNYPPALVFIDSCDSAGGSFANQLTAANDPTFANDFGSAYFAGAFLGWNGFAQKYGALAPPNDDWAFWRNALWTQFTNVNQTYAKDWANLNSLYNNKPPTFPYDDQPSTRMVPIYWDNANF